MLSINSTPANLFYKTLYNFTNFTLFYNRFLTYKVNTRCDVLCLGLCKENIIMWVLLFQCGLRVWVGTRNCTWSSTRGAWRSRGLTGTVLRGKDTWCPSFRGTERYFPLHLQVRRNVGQKKMRKSKEEFRFAHLWNYRRLPDLNICGITFLEKVEISLLSIIFWI